MFKKILVPLDRSSLAEQALGTAEAIASASNGEISLVVARPMAPYDGSMIDAWSDARDPEDVSYVRRIADEVARGARIVATGSVATGKAADAICRRAHDVEADLIVMTSHGRTGFSRAWLGSVTDTVIRQAAVPVLMLRMNDDIEVLGHGQPAPLFHRILVPLDGSTTSSSVLPPALSLARCSDATLILLRVVMPVPIYMIESQVPAYPTMIPDAEATRLVEREAEEDLRALATSLEHETSLKVETRVEVADAAAKAILGVAKRDHIDLIAMTTHGRGLSRAVLGSVTDKVLRGSDLPMLLYHPAATGRVADAPARAASRATRRMAGLPENDPSA